METPYRQTLRYYVFFINSVLQTGQVMQIFPFPRGTLKVFEHLGHLKYL